MSNNTNNNNIFTIILGIIIVYIFNKTDNNKIEISGGKIDPIKKCQIDLKKSKEFKKDLINCSKKLKTVTKKLDKKEKTCNKMKNKYTDLKKQFKNLIIKKPERTVPLYMNITPRRLPTIYDKINLNYNIIKDKSDKDKKQYFDAEQMEQDARIRVKDWGETYAEARQKVQEKYEKKLKDIKENIKDIKENIKENEKDIKDNEKDIDEKLQFLTPINQESIQREREEEKNEETKKERVIIDGQIVDLN